MIKTISLLPGIALRCYRDDRFKQSRLTVQLVRPMCRQEASLNALLPAILLRGCRSCPDLRDITLRLDDLYGASVGALVRRVGDYQTTGLSCSFISDDYAFAGDKVLDPMLAFLGELLFQPQLEQGVFSQAYTESEKENLISAIQSQLNDKRAYAMSRMLRHLCGEDSYGIPRLGDAEWVADITPASAYDHYQTILRQSRIDLFYVGNAPAEVVAEKLTGLFAGLERDFQELPAQTPLSHPVAGDLQETMDVSQGKLSLGFTTPITLREPEFAAMQVLNSILGGGMTSKLFQNIREAQSLCYDIGSDYYGTKGILAVHAGIDWEKADLVRQQVLTQLDHCRQGNITPEELTAGKQALISGLKSTHDSAGSIESYYATAALSGLPYTPETYRQAVEQVTLSQVAQAAQSLELSTTYLLQGVSQ